jgi:Holliday junction resolvase
MTEAQYQAKLIKQYEADGWTVIKLVQTNKAGYPDLLLLRPSDVRWVEVKTRTGRLSKVQEYRIEELRGKGFAVEVAKAPG